MTPKVWVSSATLSDRTKLNFEQFDITVFVGPNNAGKSAVLRDIKRLMGKAEYKGIVARDLELAKSGTEEELMQWLASEFKSEVSYGDIFYKGPTREAAVIGSAARRSWQRLDRIIDDLADFFCYLISADARLQAANPIASINLISEPLQHPIHQLQKYPHIEEIASRYFRKAFNQDLLVHRNAGNQVPLYVGEKPTLSQGQDRISLEYQEKLESLPLLEEQGDGMRSFVGVLLYSIVSRYPIILLDEPEAFLHPPQARLLGRMLAKELKEKGKRQLFIATHSGDFLRGLLDAGSSNIRVVRLQRDGDVNRVSELSNADLMQLWGDPALRYSNVLDGVFHEHVVVCEGDSDCRFYNAMLDAIYEGQPEKTLPDVMFMHGGGKHAIPALIKSLRALDVPVTAIADFDILNDWNPLRPVYESLGGTWDEVKTLWGRVKKAVEGEKPQLSSKEVKSEIEKVLANVNESTLPKDAATKIQQVLKVSSPWANAKKAGKAFVPSGDATKEYMSLNAKLRERRCFVVEVGELEGFVKSVGGSNKPEWLTEVLKKNLREDSELEDARKFVRAIFAPLETVTEARSGTSETVKELPHAV